MITAMYLRKSRAEELSGSIEDTLRRHRETLTALAHKMQLDVVRVYEEVVSGENLYARSEMLKLLDTVISGEIDAILCMDIDRLGRGTMSQMGYILETIKAAGVRIITPQKVYDLNDDADEEYTEFQSFFARRELKTIKKRMRRGIDKTVEDGGYIPNAPFGYEKCRIGKLPSLRIVEDEAKFIRIIFDLYGNKGYGCQTVADTINAMGAVPKRGAAFNRTTIMAILRNPVYIGKIAWNRKEQKKTNGTEIKHTRVKTSPDKWIIKDGVHEPIIDIDLFNRVQEIADGRYHPPYFSGDLTNPLAGIVTCSKCGEKMVRRTYTKGNFVYFLCPKAGCQPSAHFDDVEAAMLSIIKQKLDELELGEETPDKTPEDMSMREALDMIDREIAQAKTQRNRLHDLLEQGVYDVDTFMERNRHIESKLKKLSDSKSALEAKINDRSILTKKALCQRIHNVLDSYSSADAGEKNNLLKSIVKNATYYRAKDWPTSKFLLLVNLKDSK